MNLLEKIVEQKKTEIADSKKSTTLQELRNSPFFSRDKISLKKTLKSKSGIIAEFKRKSPSKGLINEHAKVLDIAPQYEAYGASAISVLTDKEFFGGSFEDIQRVRASIQIPILRKDFILDPYQIFETKALGADLILLIAACLSPSQVDEFTALSHELGLEVLLEIHTEEELNHFTKDIDLVGINNRNLSDFKVNLEHSLRLKDSLPKGILSIAESGISSREDFLFLKEKGFDGFLMGEYFMKHVSPGLAFQEFVNPI
ncbi:indole-3-glycerol phosphate synthase TrpC [Chryseobacterium sp. A321]